MVPRIRPHASSQTLQSENASNPKQVAARRVAVVVTHGMGQQIPFETIDAVATGLLAAARRRSDPSVTGCGVNRVRLGGQDLGRAELTVTARSGATDVHVYEAYWAPLTEGQIGIKETIAFLWHAGINGAWRGVRPFERWSFGR